MIEVLQAFSIRNGYISNSEDESGSEMWFRLRDQISA